MVSPKEIMEHYVINPQDSYFVNGVPPVENVVVVAYDPLWPEIYSTLASKIKNKLGSHLLKIDHVGSTAVPGLAAKPVIDIDLTVADAADEKTYVLALEGLGYRLIVREPRFHGHRLFHYDNPRVNLHVFTRDTPETARHLLFRDWLRQSEKDCKIYADAKFEAIKDCNLDIEKYHENKSKVVRDIYQEIFKQLGYF
ncbi:GrpB family protein [Dryocola clanedunensis]|uniref:GrpB family protein n=1 Tax=Cedecea sulfonylureivorans TaxID=3051154 RepID=UPI001F19B753|nr:GrpB family protein [Cedecea sulfonylureivorans]